MLLQSEPSDNIRDICETSGTSGEHQNHILDCEEDVDGNQTVSEILSLLSENSNPDRKAEVLLPTSPTIYQRSKVLSAPKSSDVPIL